MSFCIDCRTIINYSKEVWTGTMRNSGLCFGCFRIKESEEDPESTKYLDIKEFKREREIRRNENGF